MRIEWSFICKKPAMLCANFGWNLSSSGISFKLLILTPLPWKRTWPLIWINLNPLPPRMLCVKSRWYWPCVLTKKKYEKLTTTVMGKFRSGNNHKFFRFMENTLFCIARFRTDFKDYIHSTWIKLTFNIVFIFNSIGSV